MCNFVQWTPLSLVNLYGNSPVETYRFSGFSDLAKKLMSIETEFLKERKEEELDGELPYLGVSIVNSIGDSIVLLLGQEQTSYLAYTSASGDPPYYVSNNQSVFPSSEKVREFIYLFCGADSYASEKEIISRDLALSALEEFVKEGTLSAKVCWVE